MTTRAPSPRKDPTRAHPVPRVWRPTLAAIVEALARGDFACAGLRPAVTCPRRTQRQIRATLDAWGARLVAVPAATWRTSIAHWMDGWWDVLVDLWLDDGPCDLVLFVRVFERDAATYRFELLSLHVP